ncbi:MAG: hypothetical protein ACE5LH_00115 [Fidelibacterota bacterium]
MMSKEERIREENERMRKLRRLVDLTCALLYQLPLTEESAMNLINSTRDKALEWFPDKEEQFNLIYLPRFTRILRERDILTEI